MIKNFLLVVFSMWSFVALATINIDLSFDKSIIQQGSIETAVAKISGEFSQNINLHNLKSQTLGGTLYLHNISPLLRKEGGNNFESEFKIIFIKVPDTSQVLHKLGNEEITIKWSPVTISPVEVPEKFIFEQFEIPDSFKIIKWLIWIVLIVVISVALFKFKTLRDSRNQERLLKQNIKTSVMQANNYDEVVAVWKKKSEILAQFPTMAEAFKQLEVTLFKIQFKPYQSDLEKDEVLLAYREFRKNVEGGFDGI